MRLDVDPASARIADADRGCGRRARAEESRDQQRARANVRALRTADMVAAIDATQSIAAGLCGNDME